MDIMKICCRLLEASLTLVLIGLSVSLALQNPVLSGSRANCYNEGEPVVVDHISNNSCFSCVCKNGFVDCKSVFNCPPIEGCHMLVENAKAERDGCCKKCKGCIYKGVHYESRAEWTDPDDPCKVIRCEAGIITESDLKCYTPCANPLPPEPGKCCSTCPECKINGQIATEDRDVISDDPCLKCRCSGGRLLCTKKACPVLQCEKSRQMHPAGECCPRCFGTRALYTVPMSCLVRNTFARDGHLFKIDMCTNCSCQNETSICTRVACPILECEPDLQKSEPTSCCKKCIQPQEIRSQCSYNKKVYEDGQTVKMDANGCRSCKCTRGRMSCAMTRCNVTSACAPGTKLVQVPGECCQKCEEVDGVCMVFGDPHYKTFDGKLYTFQGVGKYQLVSDCQNHTFSIRVANAYSNPNAGPKYLHRKPSKTSTSTKRVAVKFGNVRLNLQQRSRIKFNGSPRKAPFEEKGQVSVEKGPHGTVVTLQNGVKILWSGKSFLEVSVPATFKNKLCGLCGNFNGNVQDDLKMRRGRVIKDSEINLFGASWCIGSKENCTKQSRQTAKIPSCSKPMRERGIANRAQNYCKFIKHSVFETCNSVVNYNKYYNTCKMDMCNCENDGCYCESLRAYARECERFGVKLGNWQRPTYCTGHSPKKTRSRSNSNSNEKGLSLEKFNTRQKNFTRTVGSRIPLHMD